eukprot:296160-Lingulodinium_polyedra.AAC.1
MIGSARLKHNRTAPRAKRANFLSSHRPRQSEWSASSNLGCEKRASHRSPASQAAGAPGI